MDVDVLRPDINTIKAAVVATTNKHVVNLSVLARVHAEVEGWTVDKLDIVNTETVLSSYH